MGAFALACTSCSDDYLTTPPSNLISSESFYKTATQSEQAIIGLYSDMSQMDLDGYVYLSECRSDNFWVDPRPNGLREYSEIGTFRAGYDIVTFNNIWNRLYKTIYDANVVLSKIEGTEFQSESTKNQFVGEIRFMRGWAYLELARFFGNVPIVSTPVSPAESKTIKQSTAKEVFDQMVIPDLTEAVNLLPYKNKMQDANGSSVSSEGRADKIAAQAMLARAYMTLAGNPFNDASAKASAKTLLKGILDYSAQNNNAYWAPNIDEWRKQWMPSTDYYNKYTIFAIQHRLKEGRNNVVFNITPVLAPSYTTKRIFGNSIYVEKSLEYEFERTFSNGNRDERGIGYSTLEEMGAEKNFDAYANQTGTYTTDEGKTVDVLERTIFYKFTPSTHKLAALGMAFDESQLMNDYDWPTNYPILRLEDMMLLYAEIIAEEGNISEAMQYVNKIRERAGIDDATATTKDEALKAIKRERRIELAGEGVRWFDEVRYGEWKEDTEKMFDRYNNPDGTDKADIKNYLCPIPQSQMNAVPGLYTQNEGY